MTRSNMNRDIATISKRYKVRILGKKDIPEIYDLCSKNTLYYEYCPPFVTFESIRADMAALPPGITEEDKYYVGYFDNDRLIAVMDLILGYPDEGTAYIGFL